MTSPKFSVIIPTYNREATIGETLDSVAAQEFRDFECIVVDDGSSDDTCTIAEKYSFVKLLRQPNAGPGAARNHGVEKAIGQYVAFLDSDDIWLPWTLQNYSHAITQYGALFISGTAREFPASHETPRIEEQRPKFHVYKDYLEAGSKGIWVGTCGVAINRDLFNNSGGFLIGLINAEDSHLWLRLGEATPFVHVAEPASFLYKRHLNSATGNIEKTVAGIHKLLTNDSNGEFPGGRRRRTARRRILARHSRPACLAALREGKLRLAWRLYFRTFWLNCSHFHIRFLLGFPVMAVATSPPVIFAQNANVRKLSKKELPASK